MLGSITSLDWWTAAGQRAAYTVAAALLPVIYGFVSGSVTIEYVFLLLGLTLIASLLTSLAGLPELEGKVVPAWQAVLIRVLKTIGQVGSASIATSLILTDVNWQLFAIEVGAAAFTTFVRTLRDLLPETASTPVVSEGSIDD